MKVSYQKIWLFQFFFVPLHHQNNNSINPLNKFRYETSMHLSRHYKTRVGQIDERSQTNVIPMAEKTHQTLAAASLWRIDVGLLQPVRKCHISHENALQSHPFINRVFHLKINCIMKKTNNNSKKLVKVTYEYLGDKFVEKPNGWAEHVLDNGNIVRGEWHKEWY